MSTPNLSSAMQQRMVPQVVTWRTLLGSILKDHPEEMERLTRELDVIEITIIRWIRNAVTPPYSRLLRLYQLLPEYQEQFLPLIRADFPEFLLSENIEAQLAEQEMAPVIPATFYRDVFELQSQASDRFWEVCELIFEKALNHLNFRSVAQPLSRVGMELSMVLCMAPLEDGAIHSLYQTAAMGTDPPWKLVSHSENILLGSESLAGYAVSGRVGVVVPDMERETLYPFHQVPHEQSVAAFPIQRKDSVAGAFVVSCTEPNYLHHPKRVVLMKAYSHLISLALKDANYYPASLVHLEPMPLWDVQQMTWASFRQRVLQERKQGNHLSIGDIEQRVRQHIEKEFLDKGSQ